LYLDQSRHPASMVTVYKTHQQLEDEDTERYLKKQADILERRKARIEAEGHKCTVEGCGQAFKEIFLLKSHINDHNEECRKAMKCNQAKCGGLKFTNRRDYNEHVDMHKEEARLKIINSIRSVLLYNKHGLLMEAFEREFRGMMGKQVPFKLLGFSSAYDLVTNMPDVVQVTHLAGGQTLLLAVPDQATEHIAKMVGNQRTNREGFNYRTGEVLASVSRDVIRKIEKIVEEGKSRDVPEFMKKQVGQLVELDMFEDGLDLHDFKEVYDQEFGYPLEYQCYGFYSLEDFVFHGLDGVVQIELDGFKWKIGQSGVRNASKTPQMPEITSEIKDNVKKLLDENPFGVSTPTFIKNYEECFEKLNLRQWRCKDVVELCYLMPDACDVDKTSGGEFTILPAGYQIEEEASDGKMRPPLWVLGEVKNNIWKMLRTLSFGVSLPAFEKGYEGYYGTLNMEQLQCKDMMDLCNCMQDVCEVKMDESGQYLVKPVKTIGHENSASINNVENAKITAGILMNIRRVLVKNLNGVNLSKFDLKYLGIIGENLNHKELGFSDLKSLLRSLDGNLFKMNWLAKDPAIKLVRGSEDTFVVKPDFASSLDMECVVQAGWVSVVKVVSPGLIYLQMEGMMDKVKNMEDSMDHFYSEEKAGLKIKPEQCHVGLVVAALSSDLSWHRGRVLAIKEERKLAEIFFVDLGQRALVKMDTLRCLSEQFRDLPMQAVPVGLSGVRCVGCEGVWDKEAVDELRDIVESGKGRAWVQKRDKRGDALEVDLFMNSNRNGFKCGAGKMTMINQMLVDKGVVEKTRHAARVLNRSMIREGVPDRDLQRLILARLVRVRGEEDC